MPETMDRRLLEVESLVWNGDAVRMGHFRCPPRHRLFFDSGPILNHVFVFPRTAIALQHEGEREFISGPNLVPTYNRGAVYRRRAITADGDACDWIQMRSDLLTDVLAHADPSVVDRPDAPFRSTSVPSSAQVYLRQRKLFRYAARHPRPDPLRIEEEAVGILSDLMTGSESGFQRRPRASGDLAEDAKAFLESRGGDRLSLTELATELSTSVFHLCRIFRKRTGFSIHEYAHQLRLRRALETLEVGSDDLLSIALDSAYSSHSHFTAAFRRRFGVTPSALRREFAAIGSDRAGEGMPGSTRRSNTMVD